MGFSLSDRVPDHTTISWNRRTRFVHTNIFFEEIFDEIVQQASAHGMVGADSTHIKANANKKISLCAKRRKSIRKPILKD
ncbi:hypothetical protein GCM10020331_098410 [Ectobacillus funiculus]